ncbi:hypothetical protein Btru_003011 [Bulinus truncatus]|nr:hypothetical protein Btru_003011 [Bulinus truncatus]
MDLKQYIIMSLLIIVIVSIYFSSIFWVINLIGKRVGIPGTKRDYSYCFFSTLQTNRMEENERINSTLPDFECTDSQIDFKLLTSLSSINRSKEKELNEISSQVYILKKEVSLSSLERKWCFDENGKRIVPSCEDQALEISKKLVLYPHLTEDVVKALRKKCTDLENNLSELQVQCDALKEEVIK